MRNKLPVKVGVITKVKEYYVTEKKLAGLINVDCLYETERVGRDIHVYFRDANQFDRFYINGVEFLPPKEDSHGTK